MMILILVVLLVALLIPLTAVILDSQVGRALAARLERDRAGLDAGAAQRLGTLESEVDRLSREVQRLDEESAFLQRLLEDRRPGGGELPPGDPTR
jgi:cell division protein FtsB